MTKTTIFPCDLCGADDAAEIPSAPHYTRGQPIHVCRRCGFVYVRQRRSAADIAGSWTNEIYGDGYTARIPAVKARQTYVADTIDVEIGLKGKRLCDIGGGEGQFLEIARGYGAEVFAVEPSPANCRGLAGMGIDHFNGTIEDFVAAPQFKGRRFNIVTVMWTLENCQSPRTMLDAAYDALELGGHIVVATGSRILVPFRKPLSFYFSTNPADTHATRYSANTLPAFLATVGFEKTFVSRYLDTDYLVVMARKTDRARKLPWTGDDPRAVLDFFARWHAETASHYASASTN